MCGCYLLATGELFDVDTFGSKSSLVSDDVYHRNEPTGRRDRIHKTNGFSVMINDDFGNLKAQIKDALKFLATHEQEIIRLAQFPNVKVLRIVFTYCTEFSANACYRFPKELLTLIGRIGIEIEVSIYPGDFHRPDES